MTEMNTSGLKHGSKSIKSQVIITYFNDHRYAIVASCYPYFYLPSLSQRVWNITTAMGNYISSMMKKKMRYGESINADS